MIRHQCVRDEAPDSDGLFDSKDGRLKRIGISDANEGGCTAGVTFIVTHGNTNGLSVGGDFLISKEVFVVDDVADLVITQDVFLSKEPPEAGHFLASEMS